MRTSIFSHPGARSRGQLVMKIIVAVKQVPVRDSVIRIDAAGKWIEEQDLSFEINEPDAYALEEALLLKEKHGGEVVVLCAGPERAGQTIREALAKGADRAIHIECDDLVSLDTFGAGAPAGRGGRRREGRPDPHRFAVRRSRPGPDRRRDGRNARHSARHHRHAGGEARRLHPRQARAGRRLVSVGRNAAARAVDHSIRHQPAALRHPHGHQEGEDQRSPPRGRGTTCARRRRPPSRSIGSTCRTGRRRRRSSPARRRKRPPSWRTS